jgi:hypothetical protein
MPRSADDEASILVPPGQLVPDAPALLPEGLGAGMLVRRRLVLHFHGLDRHVPADPINV